MLPRVEPCLLRGNPIEVCLRPRQRSAPSQPAEHVQKPMIAVRIDRQGQEQLIVLLLDVQRRGRHASGLTSG